MRSLCAIVAVLLGLCGCEQTPDFVASAPFINEAGAGGMAGAGGAGASGGIGGAAGNGVPEGCDTNIARAWFAFKSRIDVCTYSLEDTELRTLLAQHIYSQPARELTFAEAENPANRDPFCEAADEFLRNASLGPLPWRYAFVNGDTTQPNETVAVMCPRYCIALTSWLTEHEAAAEQCLPEGDP